MRNYGIVFLLLFIISVKTWAQPSQPATPTTIPFFYEKAYIHTDRDVYIQGDDLWFKAYLVDAQNNKPIGYSRNLYVELISPASQITLRHVLRMENGLGNADFKLPDTLSAGTYRIRAYTNWMRNFGDNFIFEKNITIADKLGNAPKILVAKKQPPKKPISFKNQLTHKPDTTTNGPFVQFFPEGGSLINDLPSVVAVKAEDKFGRGIALNGEVVATSGRTVAKFTCDSLGFGSLNLTPDETQDYHSVVYYNNQTKVFLIKRALHKGLNLSVTQTDSTLFVVVGCNDFALYDNAGKYFYITVQRGGKIYYKEQLRVNTTSALIQIPSAKIPEGVTCVTLYDEYAKPLCERIVYVHQPNHATLSITPSKAVYRPDEKVTVKIKLNAATKANLSLAAVDVGLTPLQPENIESYLLLRSEVKGVIQHPERYFDTTNVNRFAQLDLLLLTQGWRDFIWKDVAETKFKQRYDVEQALTITGNVRKVWNKKAMPSMNITMFAPKATGDKLFTTVSDSLGKFRIDGAVFYGYQFVNFTSRRGNQIESDGASKGKTGGFIQVDSLFQDVMAVTPPEFIPNDTPALKHERLAEREEAQQKFSFTGVNTLKTVQIKAYTNVLPPDVYTIVQADQKLYGSLMQYLLYMINGTHWELGNGCHLPGLDAPMSPILQYAYFLPQLHTIPIKGVYADKSPIDYKTVCDDDYLSQPMSNVLKVTINKRQTIDGIRYAVQVVLRPGCLNVKDYFDNVAANFTGYYQARTFYTPRHDEANNFPDYRTTLHWEPNITTDAKGEATVTFYNADPRSKIMVVVQGVTDKGVPLAATAEYKVQ